MGSRQYLLAAIAGWIVLFLLGFIVYGVLLAGFFSANLGSASGVERDAPLIWAVALGEFALAAVLTLVLGKWTKATGAANGFQVGATIGFLMAVSYNFTMYGTSNTYNLTATVADIAIATVRTGIGGSVVGATLRRLL